MEGLTGIYFFYIFFSLYFFCLFLLIYLKNKHSLFEIPPLKRHFSISVIIPAYNEGKNIVETVEAVMKTTYDKIIEIILVNDGSKDDTLKYMKELKKVFKIIKIIDKENSGKADSINQALKIARGELIAVIDSDSFPRADAFSKTVGFFEDDLVGVATIPILSRRNKTFLDKIHTVYQILVASNRKFLEKIDAIFVTPGPFALYRKTALEDIGGFDTKNITEDIEATWHLATKGWKRKMCLMSNVTTILPNKLKGFFKQRVRWTIGGFQTCIKYRKELFRGNAVGYFILPFFGFGILLGIFTLFLGTYLLSKKAISAYIFLQASYLTNTNFFSATNINIFPSVILLVSIIMLLMSAIFSVVTIRLLEKKIVHRKNFLFLLCYVLFFTLISPVVFITAIFKFVRKDIKW
jgi:biofilm PGA synthesis N-glycosyltransferase PgaC